MILGHNLFNMICIMHKTVVKQSLYIKKIQAIFQLLKTGSVLVIQEWFSKNTWLGLQHI